MCHSSIKILALTAKDIRIRRINLVLIWFGLIAGSFVLSLFTSIIGHLPIFIFPVLMSAFLSLFYLEWLISAEKEKGTFLFLRTLPASDSIIITSKILTLGLLLFMHPIAILPASLVEPLNLLAFLITFLVILSLFCGGIWGMLLFLVLKGADKYLIPLVAVLILSLVALLLLRKLDWLPEVLMTLPGRMPAGALAVIPASALLGWWLSCRYLRSRDSARLVD